MPGKAETRKPCSATCNPASRTKVTSTEAIWTLKYLLSSSDMIYKPKSINLLNNKKL